MIHLQSHVSGGTGDGQLLEVVHKHLQTDIVR